MRWWKMPQLGNVLAHKLAHQHDYSLNKEATAYCARIVCQSVFVHPAKLLLGVERVCADDANHAVVVTIGLPFGNTGHCHALCKQ